MKLRQQHYALLQSSVFDTQPFSRAHLRTDDFKAGLCRPKAVAELETTAATMRLSDSMSKSAEVWLPAVSIGFNHHNEGLVSPSGHEANELPSQDSRNGGAVVDS